MSQEILTQITSKDNKAFCVMPWVSINGEINGDFCLCCYDSDEKDR